MERHTNSTKKATVSVNSNGIYIGVKARKALGVGYNDEVRLTFPSVGIFVVGSLTSASMISISHEKKKMLKKAGEHAQGSTWHITAEVSETGGSWYDGRDLDEERYNRAPNTLPASRTA